LEIDTVERGDFAHLAIEIALEVGLNARGGGTNATLIR
jgi:hypothetical protein